MIWKYIGYVSSGLTLVAFLVAAIVTIINRHLKHRENQLKSLSESEYPNELLKYLNEIPYLNVDNLSRSQKYNLILEQINKKAERFKLLMLIFSLFTALVFIVAIISFKMPEKEEFVFDKPLPGWEQYIDKERNIAINYPNDWLVDKKNIELKGEFFIKIPKNEHVNLNIVCEKISNEYINDISRYFDEVIIENETIFKSNIIQSNRNPYRGFDALNFIAELEDIGPDSIDFKQNVLIVYDSRTNIMYSIVFTCELDLWESYYSFGEKMISTFQIKQT